MSSVGVVEEFSSYLRYAGKSELTVSQYARVVEDFLRFVGKGYESVDRRDVIRYYDYLKGSRGYSDRSLSVVGWALRSFFGYVGRNDIAMWVPVPSYHPYEEPKWLPEDVVMKVVGRTAVLATAYDLALRLREVVLLRTDRFNPITGDIEVVRLKHKGRHNRYTLSLRDWARKLLADYVREERPPPDRLFPMSARMISYIFKRELRRAGLDPKEYSFHVLRHSRATNIAIQELREKGYVDIVSLAKFLGHARPETTLMYVHLATKYLKLGEQR
ncbi:MAG: hypothetical protein DRO09_04000 [Thermoprotei archaeon]|nr:MAG: hypothetical protein DRO09_04000 [Thermoprotei archaeon]